MKVLILEDEKAARSAMQQYLTISGYEVAAVESPDAAVSQAPAFGAEVLICDWELGADRDGVDIARELQQSDGAPKVIFITGQSLTELQRAAADIDVRAYFQKPVSLRQIAQTLSSI